MAYEIKYALITGATSGIGYELAKLFPKDGYNLIIVALNEDELEKTSVELNQQTGIKVIKSEQICLIPKMLLKYTKKFLHKIFK